MGSDHGYKCRRQGRTRPSYTDIAMFSSEPVRQVSQCLENYKAVQSNLSMVADFQAEYWTYYLVVFGCQELALRVGVSTTRAIVPNASSFVLHNELARRADSWQRNSVAHHYPGNCGISTKSGRLHATDTQPLSQNSPTTRVFLGR